MARLDEELPRELIGWLSAVLPESCPPFSCRRITGGYSMLTYRLSDSAGHCWALRHPPRGSSTGRAHDTDREARVMSALRDTAVPVPRVRVVGTSDDPLGMPCHITDFVPGYVLTDADTATRCLAPDAIRAASAGIVTTLAALHSVEPDDVGLADLGPRASYVTRQLHRWRSVVAAAATPDVEPLAADLGEVADALEGNLPPDTEPRIVHGDYRLGNAIVGDDGRVRALLDWELASLGDPLADLGLLAAFWSPPARAMLGAAMPTTAPGAIGVDEALSRYVAATGADLENFWFYRALACWRLACSAFRARMRYASGAMHDTSDTSTFAEACTAWIAIARETLPTG